MKKYQVVSRTHDFNRVAKRELYGDESNKYLEHSSNYIGKRTGGLSFSLIAKFALAALFILFFHFSTKPKSDILSKDTLSSLIPDSSSHSLKDETFKTSFISSNNIQKGSLPVVFPSKLDLDRSEVSEQKLGASQSQELEKEEVKLKDITYTVKKGDTLSSVVSNLGLDHGVAFKIDAALKKLSQGSTSIRRSIRPGEEFKLSKSDGNSSLLYDASTLADVVFSKLSSNKIKTEVIEPELIKRERVVHGVISSSLVETASSLEVPYSAIDDMIDLFDSKINFSRDIHPGDSFSLIYDSNELEDGKVISTGKIKGAYIESKGKRYYALGWIGADKKMRYFNEKGEVLGNTFLRYPVKFTRISSMFSKSRFHPVLRRRKAHNGVDFAAPTGTPVRTVADGTVIYAGYKGPNGNMVKIRHDNRYSTAYVHLSKISRGIKKGAKVTRGQTIGAVGSTGRSTGPHLHYSFYDRGKYVDPLKIKLPTINIDDKKSVIPKTEIKKIIERLKKASL